MATALFAAACYPDLEVEEIVVMGVIAGYHETDPQAVVPDTVMAGAAFPVVISSYTQSCATVDRTETESDGMIATVTPYDLERRGIDCSSLLLSLPHTATVLFPEAGDAVVVFRGRSRTSDEVVFEVPVVVR